MVSPERSFAKIAAPLLAALVLYAIGAPRTSRAEQSSLGVAVGTTIKTAVDEAIHASKPVIKAEPPIELQLGSLELKSLDGKAYTEKKTRSKKVVLYFWSIYCRSCVGAMKDLEEIRSDLGKENVELLTIHLFEPSTEKLIQTVERLGISLPILLAPKTIRDFFSIRLLPTSLVFDSDRKLIARFDGNLDEAGLRLSLSGQLEQPAVETPSK